MTARGKGTLVLAAGLYFASWGFGTHAMYPVAVGLLSAPVLAWLWVRLTARPTELRRRTGHRELVEGGRVVVEVEIRAEGGLLPARATLLEQMGDLGSRELPLRQRGHALYGRYTIDPAPRGRYTLAAAELRVDDPWGWPSRGRSWRAPTRCWSIPASTARRPVHRRGQRGRRRGPGAAAPDCRLRPALDQRLPAGREPAAGALALHGQAPQADGQGADRAAAGRISGVARR